MFKNIKALYLSFALISSSFFPGSISIPQTEIIDTSIEKRVESSFTGDLTELRERRIIRVLVSHTRTNFFTTPRGFRGIEYDLLKSYENYLNTGVRKKRYETHLTFIPVPFSELLEKLAEGYGDIAASGITVTHKRAESIDFTDPYITEINEVLVSNVHSTKVKNISDLSGKKIVVVANSSYLSHLTLINQLLERVRFETIDIVVADKMLEAEDLLELVNRRVYDYTIVDNHIANIWEDVLNNIQVHPKIIFAKNSNIAWAVQKDLPELKQSLNSFIQKHAKKGNLLGNSVYNKYFGDSYWLSKPLTHDLLKKKPCLRYYFEYYSEFYDIDWQLVASLAYQESHFKQHKKSSAGAIGIMQIKPSTARDRQVNIKNINRLENNIHAGIKYLTFLKERYFSDQKYTEKESLNFALAAYNAGPARVQRLQNEAKKDGLNPFVWFYNVETVARKRVGLETVNYVASIQKMKLFLETSTRLNKNKRDLLVKK